MLILLFFAFILNSFTSFLESACINSNSDIGLSLDGSISFTKTWDTCISNIADPKIIPSFYNGHYNFIMTVNTSIQLNNLQTIDAVLGTVTIDFYINLIWVDPRIDMPIFWANMSKAVRSIGIQLNSDQSTKIWLPDISFHDVQSIDYIAETIRINSSNVVFWSRQVVANLVQAKLNFTEYPQDSQNVEIRYGSYGYPKSILQMNHWGNPISFSINDDGLYTFFLNSIWTYKSSVYNLYTSEKNVLNSIYQINVKREGYGTSIRVVFPMMLTMLLAGLTFWKSADMRVDLTATYLLTLSAMYIIVIPTIPTVGYLTNIDLFVYEMFLMLTLMIALHQRYNTLDEKLEFYPLRYCFLRLIEFSGRVACIPIVLVVYTLQVTGLGIEEYVGYLVTAALYFVIIATRDVVGLRSAYRKSMRLLIEKVNVPTAKKHHFTAFEFIFLNYWFFGKYSYSSKYVTEHLDSFGDFAIHFPNGRPIRSQKSPLFNVSSKASHRASNMSEETHLDDESDFEVIISMTIIKAPVSKSLLVFPPLHDVDTLGVILSPVSDLEKFFKHHPEALKELNTKLLNVDYHMLQSWRNRQSCKQSVNKTFILPDNDTLYFVSFPKNSGDDSKHFQKKVLELFHNVRPRWNPGLLYKVEIQYHVLLKEDLPRFEQAVDDYNDDNLVYIGHSDKNIDVSIQ